MKYESEDYDALYCKWNKHFSKLPQERIVEDLCSVMRSKLTSLIGSAQILLEAEEGEEENPDLLNAIVQSARQLSVLLDAAVDADYEFQPLALMQSKSRYERWIS